MSCNRTWIVAAGLAVLLVPEARGQGVAFFPNVSSFPNGVTLSATPVVSFDRRYVRLGMTPQFTALEGFNTYQVPAAVSGGPGGMGGGAGIPGVVGFAGMNGPIAGSGMGSAPVATTGGGMGSSRVADPNGFSSDFEDQPWPQPAPAARRAPAQPSAKARGGRSSKGAKRSVSRSPLKSKRSK